MDETPSERRRRESEEKGQVLLIRRPLRISEKFGQIYFFDIPKYLLEEWT
jgi:hypothetical protein